MRIIFKIEIEHCANCGGRLKLRAMLMTTATIERYLSWLGEPVDPPGSPWLSGAMRPWLCRRLSEPAQAELFDAH